MKTVKEIAVELENRPGTLSAVNELTGANGINIMALNVRTDGTKGVLHFVAPDPARVLNILQSAGYKATVQDVIAAEIPHHPGALNALLKPLRLAGVNIEYLYSCIGSGCSDRTIILLAVNDLSKAYDALASEWITLYGDELYNL
jgi:hypothetical protein